MAIRLSHREFAKLVEQAMDSLPQQFVPYMDNIIVEVRDRPDPKLLAEMDMSDRDCLLGLYTGIPITEKSVTAPYEMPERILIFKANIESVCDTRRQVVEQVRTTVLHEVGHHFGMDEDDLEDLGYG